MTTITLGDHLQVFGLFEGYGGLTEGVRMYTGGTLVGYAEHEPPTPKVPRPTQAAARLLAHRYPGIPNEGDVSTIQWEPWCDRIDVLAGGFPCQDVSVAGIGGGLHVGTRSGLWYEFARAISVVRPPLVVIENVPGLRTARAGSHVEVVDDEDASDLESDDWDMGASRDRGSPVLRALGAVLGTLADLGYDARWDSVRAADVGAPHKRERVFIVAWRRDITRIETDGRHPVLAVPVSDQLFPTPQAALAIAGTDAHRAARVKAGGDDLMTVVDRDLFPTPSTSNAQGNQVNNRGELLLPGVAEHMLPTPQVADVEGGHKTRSGARSNELLLPGWAESMLPTPVVTDADSARNRTANRAKPNPGHDGDTLLDAVGELLPTPAASQHNDSEDAAQWQARHDLHASKAVGATRAGLPLPIAVQQTGDGPDDPTADGERFTWGKFRGAILRTTRVMGTLPPSPTKPDGKGGKRRLAARFVEWMMLLPAGWVTGVPGLTRREELKMLGNGVVPAQAAYATALLLSDVQQRLERAARREVSR